MLVAQDRIKSPLLPCQLYDLRLVTVRKYKQSVLCVDVCCLGAGLLDVAYIKRLMINWLLNNPNHGPCLKRS
jgi:hypothetical protein